LGQGERNRVGKRVTEFNLCRKGKGKGRWLGGKYKGNWKLVAENKRGCSGN